MPLYSINDPKHWLDRAKEARALAEQMDDPEAKRTMLKVLARHLVPSTQSSIFAGRGRSVTSLAIC